MSIGASPSFDAMSNFPGGFAGGLLVQQMPILNAYPGRVFWVDYLNGSDSNRGTFARPFQTLMGAQAYLQGHPPTVWNDLVMVKQGHYENISAARTAVTTSGSMSLDFSGMTIIGLGTGDDRPRFTFGTAAAATINVTGSNISFYNCQFVANFANVTAAFNVGGATSGTGIASVTASISGTTMTVTASGSGYLYPGSTLNSSTSGFVRGTKIVTQVSGTAGGIGVYTVNISQTVASGTITTVARNFGLYNCEVRDTSSILNFLDVVKTSAVANACDGLTLSNNFINLLATSGAVRLLEAAGTNDRVAVVGNSYRSATTGTGAVIPIATGKVLTAFRLLNNLFDLQNAAATATGYLITTDGSTNTGFIHGNYDHCLANTTYANSLQVTASSGFVFGQNWHSRTADKSPGTVLPAADS